MHQSSCNDRATLPSNHLVLNYSHARLLNSHLGKGDALGACCKCSSLEDLVDLRESVHESVPES